MIVASCFIENLFDLYEAAEGRRSATDVRSLTIEAALVDSRLTRLTLPKSMILQLGIPLFRQQRNGATNGTTVGSIFGPARVTIQGRTCTAEVCEVSEDHPPSVGFTVLGMLDFVEDTENHCLAGNPAHGGEFMWDQF